MDHQSLHLYDNTAIYREYIRLQGAVIMEPSRTNRALLRLQLLNVYLEIKKRSAGQKRFAGHRIG